MNMKAETSELVDLLCWRRCDLSSRILEACVQSNTLAYGCMTVSHGTFFLWQGSFFSTYLADSLTWMTVSMHNEADRHTPRGELKHVQGLWWARGV